MSKAPPMPRLEPSDDDVERHTAYKRLNPNGDEELVVSDDEETLNELTREIIATLESIAFSGPLPTGGGMGSPEQLQSDRVHNQPDAPLMVSSDGDQERANHDDLNNLTSSTLQVADGPEKSRTKSRHRATAKGGEFPIKNIAGYRGDGLDYGATHSESFTGTGAIAIGPGGGYNIASDDDEDEDDEEITEAMMNDMGMGGLEGAGGVPHGGPPAGPPAGGPAMNDMGEVEYKGYIITKSRHPHGGFEWAHAEFDGGPNYAGESPADNRCGYSPNLEDAIEQIEELIADEEYDEGGEEPSTGNINRGPVDDFEPDYSPDGPSPRSPMESVMTRISDVNRVLREWEPSFANGEYDPGDYQMPSAPGDGVADKKPKSDKVGAYDTDTSQNGKEWPRDHKDTEAMSSVGDDGTDDGSGGYHDSSSVEATDGHQDKTGHDWPDEAKNSGSGVAEPFEGTRWSDGGTLKGSGQDEMTNDGAAQKMPSDGPITGTSGPQLGQMEGWSPEGITALMEGDLNLQNLFNNYAKDFGRTVCVEDFQQLCDAHGCDIRLDEQSLMKLMEANREFIFYQGDDANGYYWQPTPIAEGLLDAVDEVDPAAEVDEVDDGLDDEAGLLESSFCFKCKKDPCKCTGEDDDGSDDDAMTESASCSDCGCSPCECEDDCVAEGENRLPFGRVISELQVRSPGQEARPYGGPHDGPSPSLGRRPMGDPDFDPAGGGDIATGQDLGPTSPGGYDDMLGGGMDMGMGGMDDIGMDGMDMGGMGGMGMEAGMEAGMDTTCPECGEMASPGEEECPGCGALMDMGEESFEQVDDYGRGGALDAGDVDDGYGSGIGRPRPTGMSAGGGAVGVPPKPGEVIDQTNLETTLVNSPKIMEGLNRFMSSTHKILANNREFHPKHIAEALRYSWAFHARHINPHKTPGKVQNTLRGLTKRFPGFNPMMEGGTDAMESSDGTAIGTGGADNSSDYLAAKDQPGMDEMKEVGEPLGKSQKNTYEETPIITGTHKGMDGKGSVAQSVKENVARLSKHVQRELRESAKKSLRGKYDVAFALTIREGKKRNRTSIRSRLAEALADAEEVLQLHDAKDVALEATFTDKKSGTIALKQDIPLFTIKPRGLIVSEGMALFRFKRTAENFANVLVNEGATCRVMTHNWGRAVCGKVSRTLAESIFKSMIGKRRRTRRRTR